MHSWKAMETYFKFKLENALPCNFIQMVKRWDSLSSRMIRFSDLMTNKANDNEAIWSGCDLVGNVLAYKERWLEARHFQLKEIWKKNRFLSVAFSQHTSGKNPRVGEVLNLPMTIVLSVNIIANIKFNEYGGNENW